MRKIQAAALLFVTLLAGCSTAPPSVAPATCAPCPACAACPTVTPAQPAQPTPLPVPVTPPAFSRSFQPAGWGDLPGWANDDVAAAWPAFMLSCRGVASRPNGNGWKRVCDLARAADGKPGHDPRRFFEQNLKPYAVANGDGATSGMITGYYEPLLQGSRLRSKGFEQPVRGVPDDLLTIDLSAIFPELKDKRVRGRLEGNKVVPYWSRAEIVARGETLPGKTLLYVDDAVELFFLQVQGSGRVRLPDGSVVRLNYGDQNGHPYQSIGKALVERGELKLEEASMQGIQAWARANPARLDNLLNTNPSYVFFREVPNSNEGPVGARRARRAADRRTKHCHRSAFGPARFAGLSGHNAAQFDGRHEPSGHGAGHWRGDQGGGPCRFFLGLRQGGGRTGRANETKRPLVGSVTARACA